MGNTLDLDQWFRRCRLKNVLFFSSDGHFVWWSRTIYAMLVEGNMGNIHVKLF